MSSVPRIYVDKNEIIINKVKICGSDFNHIVKVLRLKEGGTVEVCNCTGGFYVSVISEIEKDSLTLILGEEQKSEKEEKEITLFQCNPKGDKLEFIVQKAVELGVTKIVPVISDRCISRPDQKTAAKKRERLQKIAQSAASQSGRLVVPQVENFISFKQACDRITKSELGFICCESGETVHISKILTKNTSKEISFLIGPEGGISLAEMEYIEQCKLVKAGLGNRILRTETAGIFVLSGIEILNEKF